MEDDAIAGGLTEIALALAMAFFCILVLALMSMGAPTTTAQDGVPAVRTAGGSAAPPAAEAERTVVLFHAGGFRDRQGRTVDPQALSGRVLLAVDPALPLTEVLAAQGRVAGDVLVAALDPAWLDQLPRGVVP
ncbi:hypothetical protein T8K17_13185 [Thalassobaculum sp. OXR-137]|uniref:hypothetical protein n=1 Tax=Thalassobaculum sp. OXR-137 TaxID=3100173 RepID=UPI002AC914AD|nr:hypothetical protein [Thalassobaculum sp. OXR-137]WPZ32195.1 hypothetical protein T8K17_13185 [Thalassobaculum sp. OXR-137]